MAVVMKQYRKYNCINCSRHIKTDRVTEGYTFGNPFFTCPHCGTLNYDPHIMEPALLSSQKLRQNSAQSWNTILLLLYMPCGLFAFFALCMAFMNPAPAALIVFPILAVLTFLILKKKKNTDISSEYKEAIAQSFQRLDSSPDYAAAVIKLQGTDPDSAYNMRYNIH